MKWFKKNKKQPTEFGTKGGWWMANINSDWWKQLVSYYKKDVDENVDEEKDAQKIYMHWIQSYLSK